MPLSPIAHQATAARTIFVIVPNVPSKLSLSSLLMHAISSAYPFSQLPASCGLSLILKAIPLGKPSMVSLSKDDAPYYTLVTGVHFFSLQFVILSFIFYLFIVYFIPKG